jgi:hypothetical protein
MHALSLSAPISEALLEHVTRQARQDQNTRGAQTRSPRATSFHSRGSDRRYLHGRVFRLTPCNPRLCQLQRYRRRHPAV